MSNSADLPNSTTPKATLPSASLPSLRIDNFKTRNFSKTFPTLNREERLAARSRGPIVDVSKLKMVRVKKDVKVHAETNLNVRRSSEEIFKEAVLSEAFRKPYHRLMTREKKMRDKDIAIVLLNECMIDRAEHRKKGNDCFVGNENAALSALDLMNSVKNYWKRK